MRLPCQNFENYTVVAFALVAEYRQTRPVQNRVPIRACRFKSCRAHAYQLSCPARQIGKAA